MKRSQEIEVSRLTAELSSLSARLAFTESQLENSVPVEMYDAVVAERDSLKKENEIIRLQCSDQLDALRKKKDETIARKDTLITELKQQLKSSQEAQTALQSENMDFKKQMEFWRASRFTASSETMTEEMNRLVGPLPENKVGMMVEIAEMINRLNRTHGTPAATSKNSGEKAHKSRAHDVQMEIFEGSDIEAFIADRCPLYTALQKEFESPPIRGACWIHFRRYLLIAFKQDERLEPAVQLLARLFAAEKIISNMKDLTEIKRVRERVDMCKPIVDALFSFMQHIKDAGNCEYGTLTLNAANYLLDDKEGFSAFLTCGLMEISNNAIERCFRHLALGRRNWLQCGSHRAAEHTAFMYSLVESCKMNKIDFGGYIEHVLREITDGNTNYRSLLPNHIVLPQKETQIKVA